MKTGYILRHTADSFGGMYAPRKSFDMALYKSDYYYYYYYGWQKSEKGSDVRRPDGRTEWQTYEEMKILRRGGAITSAEQQNTHLTEVSK